MQYGRQVVQGVVQAVRGTFDAAPMTHSSCSQKNITYPMEAASTFASGRHGEIVLVCIPRHAEFFQFFYRIPDGFWVLGHKWGKSIGEVAAGVQWWYPAYNNIAYMVTKQTVTYNSPTRQCPTADNIMVDIDLSLTFKIGPTIEDAYKFAYEMGAVRLDKFIAAQSEEAIRGLVFSVTHDHVHDLREDFAGDVLQTLRSKCEPYGVKVGTVKITDVKLPAVLMQTFEKTTSYKTKISEQRKRHENTIRVLKDHAQQDLQEVIKTNFRLKQDLDSQNFRFQTEKLERMIHTKGAANVDILESTSDRDVAVKRVNGNLVAAKLHATRDGEEIRKLTSIDCAEKMIQAANYADVRSLDSAGHLYASGKYAERDVINAHAEAEKSKGLVEKRDHDLSIEQMGLLAEIGATGRKFISGEHGKRIMNNCIPKARK